MNDWDSPIKHFEKVLALANELKGIGVAIYQHQYDTLVFGSWTITTGKRKERVKFSWDGRDGFLTYSEAVFPDSSYSTREWKEIKCEGVDFKDDFTVYDRMKQFLSTKYGV